ncbi:hypothetical protein GMORB2_6822 [Geosmithia morbida]|uniref:Uncharacterized protein n=1 Tax=Geosmithia morbida TaxID=1094350 RepID=A0A9P5D1Y9_9HYPO|nr:uncharacterized protein GMORB2_6822 [Geosmithia morbida]KAF4123272.1 hypothetical protein GMORB2_6822 [Geosmithia morbida]
MAPIQTSSMDSLDVLQDMFNDVLIKTGKALHASRQDTPGQYPSLAPTHFKIPETLQTFSYALDGMEHEIIRAKSIMLRDLERLRDSKANASAEVPQPVETQSKPPMVIELKSSPTFKAEGGDQTSSFGAESKALAPFPDMGMGMSMEGTADATDGTEPKPEDQNAVKSENGSVGPTEKTDADVKPSDVVAGVSAPGPSESDLTFTNMEFSLAAPESRGQGDQHMGQDQGESFDLANLVPAGNANDAAGSLDNLLPQTSTEQPANQGPLDVPSGDQQQQQQQQQENNQTDLGAPNFDGLSMDNMDNMDFGAADGTDFDFSMDDGNSFDDLMNSHEQNLDNTMEHGQFDADFFNLDKTDDA